MFIKINYTSEVPIYEQLTNQIVIGIASGMLKEDESLPSVRQMAEDIGINMHTVNKAYSILKRNGFVVIHKRKGVLINNFIDMKDNSFLNEVKEILKPVAAEAYCKGINEEEFLEGCKEIYQLYNGVINHGS